MRRCMRFPKKSSSFPKFNDAPHPAQVHAGLTIQLMENRGAMT